jgi:hypothetical protein
MLLTYSALINLYFVRTNYQEQNKQLNIEIRKLAKAKYESELNERFGFATSNKQANNINVPKLN